MIVCGFLQLYKTLKFEIWRLNPYSLNNAIIIAEIIFYLLALKTFTRVCIALASTVSDLEGWLDDLIIGNIHGVEITQGDGGKGVGS